MRISVVVPVFDAVDRIGPLVDSLLRQTLPPDAFEVVLVDDGSTDGTGALLDALAAEHPHLRVIHQANSGWPGAPRNAGVAAARGAYVLFADDDDWFGDDALEGLDRWVREQDPDVVVPKMVGVDRGVPQTLFARSIPATTLAQAPVLMDGLTAHKLFRRSLLLDHGIAFPEGVKRLEDHLFVVRCYLAAERVTVAADRDYYWHTGQGISARRPDWGDYYASLAEAVALVVDAVPDPALQARLLRRWLRGEVLRRISGRRALRTGGTELAERFDAAAGVVGLFPTAVDALLAPVERLGAAVVRHGRAADALALARLLADPGEHRWRFTADRVRATEDGGVEVLVQVSAPGTGAEVVPGPRPLLRFARTGTELSADLLMPVVSATAGLARRGSRTTAELPATWTPEGLLAVRLSAGDLAGADGAHGVWDLSLTVALPEGRTTGGLVRSSGRAAVPLPGCRRGAVVRAGRGPVRLVTGHPVVGRLVPAGGAAAPVAAARRFAGRAVRRRRPRPR